MTDDPTKETCPNCGRSFKRVAGHWARSSDCGYPDLPRDVEDILRGLLLTGGSVGVDGTGDGNPIVTYQSTNREFIDWIRNSLGVFAGSVVEVESPETGLTTGVGDVSEWDVSYKLKTKAHPEFILWEGEWTTSDGERTVPTDVSLDYDGLQAAYAANGRISERSGCDRASITVTRTSPSRVAVQNAFDGYAPKLLEGGNRSEVVLRNTTKFFNDIGRAPLSFATDRWPSGSIDEPETTCPNCNGRFELLGAHWTQSDCTPTLTNEQESVLYALVLAGVPFKDNSLRFRTVNQGVIDYASEALDWLVASKGVDVTKETTRDSFRDWGVYDGEPETSDVHVVQTRSHPRIQTLQDSVNNKEFTDMVGSISIHNSFYRTLFAYRGTTLPSNSHTPYLSVTNWRASDDELQTLFAPFDGSVQSDDESRGVRIGAPDKFFEVVGWTPVLGCEHQWGVYGTAEYREDH